MMYGETLAVSTRHNTSCSNSILKLKLRSFKRREYINEKWGRPYHVFGKLSLVRDPLELQHGAKQNY